MMGLYACLRGTMGRSESGLNGCDKQCSKGLIEVRYGALARFPLMSIVLSVHPGVQLDGWTAKKVFAVRSWKGPSGI